MTSCVCVCVCVCARVWWKLRSNITTINTGLGLCVTILQVFQVNFTVLESNFHIWYQQLVHHLTSVLPTYNNHISRGNLLTRIVMPYIILLSPLKTTSSSTFMSISRKPATELLCLKQRFSNCGPWTTSGPRVLPLWSF